MAINSRTKGSRNERSVAKIMADWTGYDFSRVPASGGLHWKSANSSGDIICTDQTHGTRFPFSIECKFHEELDMLPLIQGLIGKKSNKILLFWEQALKDGKEHNKVPLVFMRRNGMKKDLHFVIMSNQLFQAWLEQLDKINTPWETENGVLGYLDKDQELLIINSEDLSKTEYLAFYKAGRNIRKHGTKQI